MAVVPIVGLLAILDPGGWLSVGDDRSLAFLPQATGLALNRPLSIEAAQQPQPVPPDTGSPRRSQGSGTR